MVSELSRNAKELPQLQAEESEGEGEVEGERPNCSTKKKPPPRKKHPPPRNQRRKKTATTRESDQKSRSEAAGRRRRRRRSLKNGAGEALWLCGAGRPPAPGAWLERCRPRRSPGRAPSGAREGCAAAGLGLALLQRGSEAHHEFRRSRPAPRWFISGGGRRVQHLDSSPGAASARRAGGRALPAAPRPPLRSPRARARRRRPPPGSPVLGWRRSRPPASALSSAAAPAAAAAPAPAPARLALEGCGRARGCAAISYCCSSRAGGRAGAVRGAAAAAAAGRGSSFSTGQLPGLSSPRRRRRRRRQVLDF